MIARCFQVLAAVGIVAQWTRASTLIVSPDQSPGGYCCGSAIFCPVGNKECCPDNVLCIEYETNTCPDSGYFNCPDSDFCCINGASCYFTNEKPVCILPGATTPPFTPGPTPTETSLLTRFPLTAAAPSPTVGWVNKTINATDASVVLDRLDIWANGTSGCNSNLTSVSVFNNGSTLSFNFNGTAVYMSTTRSTKAGSFLVSLDNATPVKLDGYRSYGESTTQFPTCEFSWSQWGLEDGHHIVHVRSNGASPRDSNTGLFELNQFVITQKNDTNASDNSTNNSATTFLSPSTPMIWLLLCITLLVGIW